MNVFEVILIMAELLLCVATVTMMVLVVILTIHLLKDRQSSPDHKEE